MKNTIKQTILNTLLILGAIFISSFTLKQILAKKESKPSKTGFALLELYTSQGCSSCPPADAVLGNYVIENNPKIIPLAFHVDYWNYIGWKDPYSKASYSNRQSELAILMHTQGNYTPQIIINGKHQLVGSNEKAIQNLVNEELALTKQHSITLDKLSLNENLLSVSYTLDTTTPNTVNNLALVKKKEVTSIKKGENSGLKQTHYNIVYDYKTVPNATTKVNLDFRKDWHVGDFIVVGYLENTKTGQILAATKSEIK